MSRQHPFPKRAPLVAHGLAAMLGAHTAGGMVPQPGPQAQPMGRPVGVTASEADAQQALQTLVDRVRVAELREAIARKHLVTFRAQVQALPAGHVARTVTEKIVDATLQAMERAQ